MLMKEPPQDRDNVRSYWEGSPPPRYNNVMTWWVEPNDDKSGARIKYGTGNLGRNGVHWEHVFTIGEWHQLGMHIHWSEDPANGNARLWWDGEVVLDKKVQTKVRRPNTSRNPAFTATRTQNRSTRFILTTSFTLRRLKRSKIPKTETRKV